MGFIHDADRVTKDTEIVFSGPPDTVVPIPGERILVIVSKTEDVKAHPLQYGQFIISNIRVLWFLPKKPGVNVSIGFDTIQSQSVQDTDASTETLYLMCKMLDKNYEFIFRAQRGPRSMFEWVEKAVANYKSSLPLINAKLRMSLFSRDELALMESETIVKRYYDVVNVAGDVGKSGTAVFTNRRYIWYSELVSAFNTSIPFISIQVLKPYDHPKFGKTMYIRTYRGSDLVLGFIVEPSERLAEFAKVFETLRKASVGSPKLTADIDVPMMNTVDVMSSINSDDFKEEEDLSLKYIPFDNVERTESTIVFDKYLGLAIESLPDNSSTRERWRDVANIN